MAADAEPTRPPVADPDHVLISTVAPGDDVPIIVAAAEQMCDTVGEVPGQEASSDACDDAVRALGSARTASSRTGRTPELRMSAVFAIERRRRIPASHLGHA